MVDKVTQSISRSLLEAFRLTWDMYEDAIKNIPEDHWRIGDIDYLIPSRIVYHVLETADFYSSSKPEGFPWGHRFNVNCWDASPEQLPTKDQARKYHEEMRDKVGDWLRGMEDSDLLSSETAFHWTGGSVLGRVLYLLSHYRQHMGEINAELRRHGLPRIKWQTL